MYKLNEDDINRIVEEVIKRLKKPSKEELTKKEKSIINKVCNYTGISYEKLISRSRKTETVRARYIVFTELITKLKYSLSEAGAVLGYNHATALYAKNKLTGGEYQMTKYYHKYLKSTEKMKTINPNIKVNKIDFPGNQYVQKETKKRTFIIHHSAGWDNARNMFHHWKEDKQGRVATAYGITDNGNIFHGFDASKYYAYAIYINSRHNYLPEKLNKFKTHKHDTLLNSQAIQCEICNWGGLTEKNGKFYSWAAVEVPADKVVFYPEKFRGYHWFEKYTDNEIKALEKLIIYHAIKDNIPVTYNPDMWDISERAIRGAEGIWSHVSYRTDKSDAHPQPELVSMLMRLEDTLFSIKNIK